MLLIKPERKYYNSYQDAMREYKANGVCNYCFSDLPLDQLFQKFERYHENVNLPADRVGATYLWLVEGDDFIGEIAIRHQLTASLLCYGGHIGYGIRCSRWNQGLGTHMLSMALDYIRQHFDFDSVLITCDDGNTASARVIEKNGGVLQDKICNTIEQQTVLTRRYWIKIHPIAE